jgi:hypothetical protein
MEPSKRKVVQRSPAHTVRLLHLPHLQDSPVEAESSLERDFVQIAALFSFIESIEHQPFRLVWDDATYTPDFLIRFKDGSQLVVEVKPSAKVDKYRTLFDRASEKLKGHKLLFMVATDTQLQAGQRVANAMLIRRYAKTTFAESACDSAIKLVDAHTDGISFTELCSKTSISHELILHLVARRLLALGPDLSMGPTAQAFPVTDPKEPSHAIQFAKWFDVEIWG